MIRQCKQQLLMDQTDLAVTRKTRDVSAEKANALDNIIALISITTYLADVVTDGLAANIYYERSEWVWFSLNITFMIFPSVIMQLVSSKWYHEDFGTQKTWSVLLHFLQLGPVQRYCAAFWSGLKTLCASNQQKEQDYLIYLTNWRDVTMLRLIEGFLESAPQVVLQLYIASTTNKDVEWKKDPILLVSVSLSVVSLAWSIVSYSHALRLCARETGLSLCGYIFQVMYRLFMIASRIVALVLFASEYKGYVLLVTFIHWLIMIAWLHFQRAQFFSSSNKYFQFFLDKLFVVLMAFIHIFCFINTQEGTSRQRVSAFYIFFFVENSLMLVAWYFSRTGSFGTIEWAALVVVWGGFFLGIVCMLVYYKLFHPTQDITAGWLCCVMCSSESESETSESRKQSTSNAADLTTEISFSPSSSPPSETLKRNALLKKDKLVVDVEFSPRSDISEKSPVFRRKSRDEQVYRVNGQNGHLQVSNSSLRESRDAENAVNLLVVDKKGGSPISYGSTSEAVAIVHAGKVTFENPKPSTFI